MPLSYDLTTFQILGQKSVKFFGGFLENLKFPKDILKLSDLYNKSRKQQQKLLADEATRSLKREHEFSLQMGSTGNLVPFVIKLQF